MNLLDEEFTASTFLQILSRCQSLVQSHTSSHHSHLVIFVLMHHLGGQQEAQS